MTISLEQAKRAKEQAVKLLMDFSAVASPSSRPLVNAIGIGKDKEGNYMVAVRMDHEPTPQEKAKLPKALLGVPLDYKVIGPIKFL